MYDINNVIEWLRYEEPNVYAVAVINSSGKLIFQTDNWDVSSHLAELQQLINENLSLGQKGTQSIVVQGVKYMIVENTDERKIGTNVQNQGHFIVCPIPPGGTAALICYVSPEVGPRDALLNIQLYATKLVGFV